MREEFEEDRARAERRKRKRATFGVEERSAELKEPRAPARYSLSLVVDLSASRSLREN